MINKLLPDQISSMWPVIKYAVEESLAPTVGESPDKMNRILSSMLCGRLDVWAVYDRDDRKFEGVLVTRVIEDDESNTRNMLLYCLYGYAFLTQERWLEGYETISKYAKSLGCSNIIAYTNVERLVNIAKEMGATTYTFISVKI